MSVDTMPISANHVHASDDEARRLEALHRYGVLDTAPEAAFDRITDLAAHVFDVPMAIVTFIGDDRHWMKSCAGLNEEGADLDLSVCVHTIESDGILVVEDATDDPRFADNPLVAGDAGVRFYTGAPLVTPDGYRIGTICVLDTEPRFPSQDQLHQLENLAEMAMDELELRRQVSERERTEEKVRRIVENAQPIVFMIDREGQFTLSEGRDLEALGLEPGEAVGASVHDMFSEYTDALDVVDRALEGETVTDLVTLNDSTFDVWCAPYHDASGEVAGCIGMSLDITERKRTQQELERNRDRLRRTQKIANVGGWEFDVRTETLVLSDEACRIHDVPLGTTIDREEAINYYTPSARPTIKAAVRRAIETGESWELELPFVTATGDRRWIRSIGEPRYEGDEVVKLVGAAQDVTERHEAEEALRESERRHREFMERSPVGIYRSTADGRFLYANDALVDMLGFGTFDEMAERNLNEEGFGLKERESFVAELDAKGAVTQRETTWIGPHGETIHLLESAHVVEQNGTTVYEGVVEDITERVRAKQQLQESHERLRLALEAADAGTFEFDVTTGRSDWDERTLEIYGLSGERRTADPSAFFSLVHPDDRADLKARLEHVMRHEEQYEVSYRVVRPDGEERHVRSSGIVKRDDEGTARRVIGLNQDVTEQKRAEQKLQEGNQRLRLSLEAANAGTFDFDLDTERVVWDAETLSIYGLDREPGRFAAEVLDDLVHPEDQAHLDETFYGAVRDEETDQYDVTYRIRRPDGEERYVESYGIVLYDEDGTAERVIGINRDVTEREKAEQELRRSRERWRRLVNAHRDPIQIAVDGVIRYINPAGAELFGASSPADVVGRSVLDFAPNEDVTEAIKARKKKLDRGEPTPPFEHEIERLDGERRLIEAYSVPIEYDGRPAAQTVLRDVTEQREAEEALRESKAELEEERQRLEMALIGGRLGLWDVNFDTGRNVVDARWAEMLGYSLDEVEQTVSFFESLVHPEDLPKVYDALDRNARGEIDVMSVDIRMKAKDGSWRWIRDKGKVVERDDDGNPLRAVGTHQDVTEERRRQEALRRSRQKYKSLFDASNEAIFIHDLDGEIRDVNARARDLFRYGDEELVGRNVADLVPEDRSRAAKQLNRVSEGGSIHSENKYRRKDGSVFWGELSATMFETETECLVQGMIRDVTDRKEAERALRESEARLRGLANSVPGIIFQFYVRPEGEYGMYFVSEQSQSLLGLDPVTEGYFERFADRVDPSYRDEFLESVDEAVDHTAYWNFEMPFNKPSGDTIWVHGIAMPEEREDEVVFNGVLLDITERKQLESQLRQAQKMETVGTLAGGIAHDFNNILHAAMVYLRMGLEDLPDGHATADFLTRAEKGLQRAEDLVDKLLTFSRQEGKTVEECVNVSSVIEETVDLVETSIPDHVQVRAEMDDECCVMGDPGQLQQVAVNLLTNAAQALEVQDEDTDEPSVLDIDVRSTEVDEDLAGRYLNLDPGRYVRFTVSDTGPGMDQETKERIFEPFFTTKDVGKGTGLGLSMVHGIVQAHEGEITVFTQPGEGTTFNVYIPCAGEGDLVDEATDPADEGPTGHVLFVDDDEQVVDLESVRLRGFGYEVTTCQNARAALEAVEAEPATYDLVLTDYAMPGMNGLAFMRELRERGYDMPIILMSGFSAKVSEEDVFQAGAEAFLRKPVGSSELEDALDDAL